MGLFDLPDDAKEKLDAIVITGTNIAEAIKILAKAIDRNTEALKENTKSGRDRKCDCGEKD